MLFLVRRSCSLARRLTGVLVAWQSVPLELRAETVNYRRVDAGTYIYVVMAAVVEQNGNVTPWRHADTTGDSDTTTCHREWPLGKFKTVWLRLCERPFVGLPPQIHRPTGVGI